MCLAVPARVVALDRELATVELDGVRQQVSLALVDDVDIGDYLLIHVGYALQRLSEAEAKQTLAMFDALGADA